MSIKTNLQSMVPRKERFKRVIDLVSGGYANPTAFPSGKCTVFPWDSLVDEWLLEFTRKGDRGTVLFHLVERLCNLNGCPIKDFVLGDVNTILLVSRSIQNDNLIHYTSACPACRATCEEQIKVPDELVPLGSKPAGYLGIDLVTLPDCGDEVGISPLRVGDEIDIMTRTPRAREEVSDNVARIITAAKTVGGGRADSIEEALEWYMALSPKDAKYLEDQITALTPHLDQNIDHACDACGKNFVQALTFDEDFFRAGGASNARGALEQDIQPSVGRKGARSKPQGRA